MSCSITHGPEAYQIDYYDEHDQSIASELEASWLSTGTRD